jgi:hypothetical protein
VDLVAGAQAFQILATHLREAGETGLRRELTKAVNDAAKPATDLIKNVSHLRAYMPDRYADVLAQDLQVTTHTRIGGGGVTVNARAPTIGRGGRKVRQRNQGRITHPLFGDKQRWYEQTAGMEPGFFDDPLERAAPQIRDSLLEAMHRVADEITRRT